MRKINQEIIKDILTVMPENKKAQLKKALDINEHLTSSWVLDDVTITIYLEGFYVEFIGTRCGFKVWASDNDGEFVFTRKPNESKLHKLYDEWENADFLKFADYVV